LTVKNHNIKHFFDVGVGVCHQLVVEKGFSLPGQLLLGSDSHTCSYGAIGAFSSGIDRTEAASLMLTGETWLKVPNSIKITLKGKVQIIALLNSMAKLVNYQLKNVLQLLIWV